MAMSNATAIPRDAETRAAERPDDHVAELRLWLRMLTCANMIEAEVRRRLRLHFNTTLPRFDVLAQLDKSNGGMTLGELSQRMMVSNGNVTGLVDRLVGDGLIAREASREDRRVQIVKLTPAGRRAFRTMARANGDWISDMFAGLDEADVEALMELLAKTKVSARQSIDRGGDDDGR